MIFQISVKLLTSFLNIYQESLIELTSSLRQWTRQKLRTPVTPIFRTNLQSVFIHNQDQIYKYNQQMIAPYDRVKESVKKYQDNLKGKGDKKDNGHDLPMKVIIEKNRKIYMEEKLHKQQIIKARKLRIKISQVFQFHHRKMTAHKQEIKQQEKKSSRSINFRSRTKSNQSIAHSKKMDVMKKSLDVTKSNSFYVENKSGVKLPSYSSLSILKREKAKTNEDEMGGMINLFDKFSEEEQNMMESIEDYYFVKKELKDLFRRYLVKKRLNNKDLSYENFMLKSTNFEEKKDYSKASKDEAKKFILSTIKPRKLSRKISYEGTPLLTNPLQKERRQIKSLKPNKSISISHKNFAQSFREFKSKQKQRIIEVRRENFKKVHNHQIETDYFAGIVAQNRANIKIKQKKAITSRNAADLQRSRQIRNRLKSQRQTYGQSVELAESMRSQFIKTLMQRKLKLKESSCYLILLLIVYSFILFPMQLQGLKGLPKLGLFSDQAFESLEKKLEEFKKGTKDSFEYFQIFIKNSQVYTISFSKSILGFNTEGDESSIKIPYYSLIVETFGQMLTYQKQFAQVLTKQFKEATQSSVEGYTKEEQLMKDFEIKLKTYQAKEQSLIESHKKYTKLFKSMTNSIQSYKQAFTDVKLIYNREQKIRRYMTCQATYAELMYQVEVISQLTITLTQDKKQMQEIYQELTLQNRQNIMSIGESIKTFQNTFVQNYCQFQNKMMNTFNQTVSKISKIKIEFRFILEYLESEEKKYLNEDKALEKHPFIPSVILNNKNIMETHYPHIRFFLVYLQKELNQIYRRRKTLSKQFFDLIVNLQKDYEKYFYNMKDFNSNFERKKKRSTQYYGNNYDTFIKAFDASFDICLPSMEKVWRQINTKIRAVQLLVQQESKIIEVLFKQFKIVLQKISKSQDAGKKSKFERSKSHNFEEVQRAEMESNKKEIIVKLQQLKVIFQQSYERIKKNCEQIQFNYHCIIEIIQMTAFENYANIKEQIDQEIQRVKNRNNQLMQKNIDEKIVARTKYFEDGPFGCLLSKEEQKKISFEPDLNKVEEFTKLKKPVELIDSKSKIPQEKQDIQKKQLAKDEVLEGDDNIQQGKQKQESNLISQKQTIKEKLQKREAYLRTKISFLPNQKYCDSYSCGLADKIILTGRLYITTHRLCFSSKFNPKNVFFGHETFLEIPRQDIKKIQKRSNAVIFDNSISITTINGQVFFTSFFSRNEAYDKICSVLQIIYDEMYVQEVNEEVSPVKEQHDLKEEEDDMKEEDLAPRLQKINAMLKDERLKEFCSFQFNFKGLNALKFFRMFELSNEISYNRAKYKGFNAYFKTLLGHTQMDLGQWSPDVETFFNSGNIKSSMPLQLTKKNVSTVPVANSGVPFMPKTTRVFEKASLHFYSKDRYIICTNVVNKGVPYCDDFEIHFLKEVQSVGEDKCSMKVSFYMHFFKSIMVKSIIQSRSLEESKAMMKKMEDQINKYLKHLNKLQSNSRKLDSLTDEKAEQISDKNKIAEIQELEGQVDFLQKQKSEMLNTLNEQRNNSKKLKNMLLGSVVFNILLLLILFT